MPDELLNHHADRFVRFCIGALLKITFAEYLLDPERYDQAAWHLVNGGSLCTYYQPPRQVGQGVKPDRFKDLKNAI